MLSRILTSNLDGLNGSLIHVEAEILNGFSAFHIVGLASASVLEAKERIRSSLQSLGLKMPLGRIIINLVPASEKKLGTHFDLPMAIALLSSMGLINKKKAHSYAYLGELSLDGKLRHVKGAFALALTLLEQGYSHIILPKENLNECKVIDGLHIYAAESLQEVYHLLRQEGNLELYKGKDHIEAEENLESCLDFSDLIGQKQAKRVLQIAAMGRHSTLFIGPPGVGKTMAFMRYPSILTNLDQRKRMEVSKIYSMAGLLKDGKMITKPVFRSPHFSITKAGFIGGGNPPSPGEVTLAHHGVLFLDELLEFDKNILNLLRAPIEDKEISLARGKKHWTFPSNFQLLASMNPCPCGYFGSDIGNCTCKSYEIERYLKRLSKPLLDRIDLRLELNDASSFHLEKENRASLSSKEMKEQVVEASAFQREYRPEQANIYNAEIKDDLPLSSLKFSNKSLKTLNNLSSFYPFSMRSLRRIALISRSIADLELSEKVEEAHVLESVQYRSIEFKYWP